MLKRIVVNVGQYNGDYNGVVHVRGCSSVCVCVGEDSVVCARS